MASGGIRPRVRNGYMKDTVIGIAQPSASQWAVGCRRQHAIAAGLALVGGVPVGTHRLQPQAALAVVHHQRPVVCIHAETPRPVVETRFQPAFGRFRSPDCNPTTA